MRQVALHDHRRRIDLLHLGDRGTVHGLGVRRLAGLGALHRPTRGLAEPARLDLAEVHVVHGGEAAQQRAGRSVERAHHRAEHVVVGVGLQALEPMDHVPVVGDDQVVGDGGDVHGVTIHGPGCSVATGTGGRGALARAWPTNAR